MTEIVVLLHGILRSRTDMLLIERALRKADYIPINIRYPSRTMPLEELTDFVAETIKNHEDYDPDLPINFVTHSMGGLITRYYLATHRPDNLNRVVMLSPPNTGSEFADFFDDHKMLGEPFRKIFGPAGPQLRTDHEHITGDIDYPLGIIAGSASINPLAPWVLEGEHDGIVPVERTKIDGMADHIVIFATHSFMMFNPKVIAQTIEFLDNGKFNHQKPDLEIDPETATPE